MAGIEVRGLTKRFGETTAVNGISFSVGDGEVLSLLGPSGCGKTTILRCVAGLEQPGGGEIVMGGTPLCTPSRSIPPERRNIGMVFQSYALWPHMTVAGNIGYGLHLQRRPSSVIHDKVASLLRLTGLEGLEDRYIGELSGGQQQRVAVARALAPEPEAILFDEPLSNLDRQLREETRFELRRVVKQLGITAVYVTHDVSEAVVVSDRIAVMNRGNIEQIGSPTDIYFRPRSVFVAGFVGNVNLLRATVIATDGSQSLHVNEQLVFAHPDSPTQLRPGQTLDVVLRPEHVQVSASPPAGGNRFRCEVTDVSFLGERTEYRVRVGPTELRASAVSARGDMVRAGSSCYVQVRREDIICIP